MRAPNAIVASTWMICCLGLTACGDSPRVAPTVTQDPMGRKLPPAVTHDFGIIPHGESRTHDYVLDVQALGDTLYIPLRAQLDCSCGRATLIIRDKKGVERTVDGRPNSDNAVHAGETLITRVRIDTLTKDAVDLPKAASRAYVVLQPVDDATGLRRVNWPMLLHFGIDSPVVLSPFAAVDFAAVPQSALPEMVLSLRGDQANQYVKFGPARSSDPSIEVELETENGSARLRVRCRPGQQGNGRAVIAVDTNLASGYRVNIGVTWKVVPDLVASPTNKISFRARLDRAQTAAESSSQYIQIINHDVTTSEEFAVQKLVGSDGIDASSNFEVRFEVAPGRPRQKRMFVRYLGGLGATFRGQVTLTVGGESGPFLPIYLVVFPIKN